jgi:starch synthase
MTLRVLSIASEAVPLIKTGGLADVAGALPAALAPHGVEMTTLLPGYPKVLRALAAPAPSPCPATPCPPKAAGKAKAKAPPALPEPVALHHWDSLLGEPARLLEGTIDGHRLLVLDCPALFVRDGGPYGDAAGRDWDDNWRRFAAFGRAGADLAGGVVPALAFDLVHAHDWQAAMAPAYIRFAPAGPRVPSVMTIHNMAFQGRYGPEIFPRWACRHRPGPSTGSNIMAVSAS